VTPSAARLSFERPPPGYIASAQDPCTSTSRGRRVPNPTAPRARSDGRNANTCRVPTRRAAEARRGASYARSCTRAARAAGEADAARAPARSSFFERFAASAACSRQYVCRCDNAADSHDGPRAKAALLIREVHDVLASIRSDRRGCCLPCEQREGSSRAGSRGGRLLKNGDHGRSPSTAQPGREGNDVEDDQRAKSERQP